MMNSATRLAKKIIAVSGKVQQSVFDKLWSMSYSECSEEELEVIAMALAYQKEWPVDQFEFMLGTDALDREVPNPTEEHLAALLSHGVWWEGISDSMNDETVLRVLEKSDEGITEFIHSVTDFKSIPEVVRVCPEPAGVRSAVSANEILHAS